MGTGSLEWCMYREPKCVTFPGGIVEFALSTRIELDLSAKREAL